MKAVITIDLSNEAFQSGGYRPEVARILRNVADILENGGQPMNLRDCNGNTVGEYRVTK